MAIGSSNLNPRLIHHSDREVQYACQDFRALLEVHRIECSMSRKGDCWDNAVAESFFYTLKVELLTTKITRPASKHRRIFLNISKCFIIGNAATRILAIPVPSSLRNWPMPLNYESTNSGEVQYTNGGFYARQTQIQNFIVQLYHYFPHSKVGL